MSISFPNKQAETLASAIISLARAFAKGREKHTIIPEAFPDHQNYYGKWASEKLADQAIQIVDVDKQHTMTFDRCGHCTKQYFEQLITPIIKEMMPQGTSVELSLPETRNELITATIHFQ